MGARQGEVCLGRCLFPEEEEEQAGGIDGER